MNRLKVGDSVVITHGTFASAEGKLIVCKDLNALAGLSLAPGADREQAIPVAVIVNGRRLRIGVSPEFLQAGREAGG